MILNMKVVYDPSKNYRYAFEYPFNMETLEFCRYLKTTLGWQNFCFYEKKWRFNRLDIVDMIKNRYPGTEVSAETEMAINKHKLEEESSELVKRGAEQLKTKVASNLVIKGLKQELYPYQKIGVEFFINNNGRAILADTMGLGKTATSLAYVVHQKIPKTLVVCPASVKWSWDSEVKKWTNLNSIVINSRTKLDFKLFQENDIFIINYDIIKKFFEILMSLKIDLLICDEFHYIKNSAAHRTKLVKLLSRNIPAVLLLSGTPLLSRPVELFNGLSVMDRFTWNNFMDYTKRYCNGHAGPWGWDARGASNMDELQQRIGRYFLRRKKEDVLPELPDKRFVDIPVELSNEKKFEYDLVEDNFVQFLKDIKNKTDKEINKTMQAEKLTKLNELRQITSAGKIESAQEIIQNIIDSGEKVVVFSVYNGPLEKLYKEFENQSVMLTGDTPEIFRREMIKNFQEDKNIKIFFGGIKSAGVGITLTAASNVLFLDFSWVPSDHNQAMDRIHRIGQKADSITIYQLFAKDTIDEKMKELLGTKQRIFNKLIEQENEDDDGGSVVGDLLSNYYKTPTK